MIQEAMFSELMELKYAHGGLVLCVIKIMAYQLVLVIMNVLKISCLWIIRDWTS